MQQYSLLKNPLITSINNDSVFVRPKPTDLKNTQKTIVKILPHQTFGSASVVYNRRFLFDIPRNYDHLSQMCIKCTVSNGSTPDVPEIYFGLKMFKTLVLRTKGGNILQTLTPEYQIMRLDEIINTGLYDQIVIGLEPTPILSTGTSYVYIPLFFFFSTSVRAFLQTRNLEPLELECFVNESQSAMGAAEPLTSASFELFATFFDTNTSNKVSDQLNTVKPEKLAIVGSYDIFQEDTITVSSGATSAKLLLRCSKPIFAVHCILKNATTQQKQINTFKLTSSNKVIAELDYQINYALHNNAPALVDNGTFSFWFSKEQSRDVDSGLTTFSKPFFPCFLEITFDALTADYELLVFEEVRTSFEVSDRGFIGLSDGFEHLEQGNSSTLNPRMTG